MGYDPPESASGNKPLPERPANTTNAQDYKKSSENDQQKDINNGKW